MVWVYGMVVFCFDLSLIPLSFYEVHCVTY